MVWPSEDQEGELVFSFDAFEYLQAAPLHLAIETAQRFKPLVDGEIALVLGDCQSLAPNLEHLALEISGLLQRHRAVHVIDPSFGKKVDLLGDCRLHHIRGSCDNRTGRRIHHWCDEGWQVSDAGKKMKLSGFCGG